jgi:parvulin-like peptidyl-prolyl isomerase
VLQLVRHAYELKHRKFPAVGTTAFRTLRDQAVALLVGRVEVRQKAAQMGIVVSEADVDARIGQIKQQWGSNEREFRKILKRLGLTPEALRDDVRARLTLEAVREELTASVEVSDQEIADFYQSHLADYTTPPSRNIRHILVRRKVVAQRLYARLRAGASFVALARRYSRDANTRRSGGVLTVFAGKGDIALQRYAFSLATGALAPPLHLHDGWHVIKAISPIRPSQAAPLAKVAPEIKELLFRSKGDILMAQWLDQLKWEYATKVVYQTGFAPGSP